MGQYNSQRSFALLLIIGTLSLQTTGCLFSYYVKSGYEQLKILNARKPIDKILADPKVPEPVKSKLRLSVQAQKFAEAELKFEKTDNYTSYVELGRPYVSWIVSVAHKDRLEYKMFNYAIVGKLPYKGFFEKEGAEAELKKYPTEQFDTMMRGVSAYSTLGWFEDPLLSTMMSRSDATFVELVLHESAHATVFVKSNANFNEQLASFLGVEAAKRFFLATEGVKSKNLQELVDGEQDDKIFSRFLKIEIDALKVWYKGNAGKFSEAQRQERLQAIQNKFKKEIDPKLKTKTYSYFANAKINNALLLSLGTYLEDLDLFTALLKKKTDNLQDAIVYLKTLKNEKDPAKALQSYVASSPAAPAEAVR